MTELAILDVDGTLVDSLGVIHAAMCGALRHVGRPAPAARSVKVLIGLSVPRMVEALMPSGSEEEWDEATGEFRLRYREGADELGGLAPLREGVGAFLDQMDEAGVGVALATSRTEAGVHRLLDGHGLRGRFRSIQCGDIHPSKPHPSAVRRALADTGVARGRAVVAGDTSYDMEMARAAKVRPFGVGWGYHDAAVLQAAGARAVAADFDALAAMIVEAGR
ncbi:HAD hydrolase-like protein [Jannaschia sp. W003]|uniref:HAD hydrolase-like protein n=1 Tax=Jannaschia sp. W003 TaxID=2867012 RepID=UPI0021A5E109|nr:HAD hydrolase-like protein [Jannaschia sp. W003]UWQ21214.1 HAD hydrolase-like protein [Jannaschia sp. W003]